MKYKLMPLTEVTLLKDKQNQLSLSVDSEFDRVGDWYFKFYVGTDYRSSPKVSRIKFETPDYVFHNDGRDWLLTSKIIKKYLIPMLLEPFIYTKKPLNWLTTQGFNNWTEGMYIFNNYMSQGTIPLEMFSSLKRSDNWYEPKFIPIADMTFPQYIKLTRYNKPKKLSKGM